MKTNHHLFLLLAAMLLVQTAYGQVTNNVELPTSINNTGNAPNSSAILDVQSTTQGMLVPRMTSAQRTAISSPATGLLVFDTSTGGFWFYNGLSWLSLSGGGSSSHWQADTFNGGINYTDRIAVNHVETDPNAELFLISDETGGGKSGIYALRLSNFNAADGGSSWSDTGIDAAIKGYSQTGNTYSTAIYGSSYLNFNNSASVVGAHSGGATYGALGYKDGSGNIHAGYFEGDVNVNGRAVVNGSINDDADLHITQSEYGEGKSAIKAYRSSSLNAGISWGVDDVDGVIHSASYAGEQYNAALYGANDLTNAHNAGVVGYEIGGASYGALAYRDELNGIYAGYFQGDLQTNGNHGVTGTSNLNGDLNLGGDGYVTGDFNMNNDAYVTGDLQVTNGIATDGSLTVDGASNFNSGANVTGSLSIDDGTQAAGRVLTSDASGTASWQDAPSDGHWLETFNGIYRPTGSVGLGMAGAPVNSVIHVNQLQSGANKAGLSVHRGALTSGGTDWSDSGVDAGIKSWSLSENSYNAAIYGSGSFVDNETTAAVLGASSDGNIYGALGYRPSNLNQTFAGYFNGRVGIAGDELGLSISRSVAGPSTNSLSVSRPSLANNSMAGTDWSATFADAGIFATSTGNSYSTSIYATSNFSFNNSAAVWGGTHIDYGALGYKDDNGDMYAGYFNGNAKFNEGKVGINVKPNDDYELYIVKSSNDLGAGKAGIKVTRYSINAVNSGGVSWYQTDVDAGINSNMVTGYSFSSAIYGTSGLAESASAAVIGTNTAGSIYGALGYNHFGTIYAGYFNGNLRIKQTESANGLIFENHNAQDTWKLGMIEEPSWDFSFTFNNFFRASISNVDGSYVQSSDRSLKANIEYLDGVLPKVMALKPAKYHYKSSMDAPQKSHGFIAQEVQEIFPEIVRKTEEGTLALAYDDFAILAVQAIKEQQEIIDEQQAEIEAHQTDIDELKIEQQKNAELEKRLEKLEALLLDKE